MWFRARFNILQSPWKCFHWLKWCWIRTMFVNALNHFCLQYRVAWEVWDIYNWYDFLSSINYMFHQFWSKMVLISSRQKYGLPFSCCTIRFKLSSKKSCSLWGVYLIWAGHKYRLVFFTLMLNIWLENYQSFRVIAAFYSVTRNMLTPWEKRLYEKYLSVVKNTFCFALLWQHKANLSPSVHYKAAGAYWAIWLIMAKSLIFALFFHISYY